MKVVKAVEAGGIGETARRVFEVISQIFRYAIAHGLTKRNPAADIKPADVLKPFKSRNLARIDASALPGLLRSIEVYQGKVLTRLAMKLMALTFPRTAEIIGGRWTEIDFEGRRWNIPPERMKMDSPHIIPLFTQAIEVLALLQTLTGEHELMFSGDVDPRKPMSKIRSSKRSTAWDAVSGAGNTLGRGFGGRARPKVPRTPEEPVHCLCFCRNIPKNTLPLLIEQPSISFLSLEHSETNCGSPGRGQGCLYPAGVFTQRRADLEFHNRPLIRLKPGGRSLVATDAQ